LVVDQRPKVVEVVAVVVVVSTAAIPQVLLRKALAIDQSTSRGKSLLSQNIAISNTFLLVLTVKNIQGVLWKMMLHQKTAIHQLQSLQATLPTQPPLSNPCQLEYLAMEVEEQPIHPQVWIAIVLTTTVAVLLHRFLAPIRRQPSMMTL
jgi:hypothetical protein